MAWDDPVVWVLIIAVVVFLFGANKIPEIAKGLGQARKEFEQASKELTSNSQTNQSPTSAIAVPQGNRSASITDPLIIAAQNEGIDTRGKTREQIASELAWKLKSY